MDRQKVENRIRFNVNDKRRFLAKSDGVCAHCGKKLDIKSATVEHAVPLGKAGRNEERNLVALCEECNSNKADSVILKDVPNYYKYLNMESLLVLLEYIEEYKKEFNWFTWNNWCEEDMFITVPQGVPSAKNWLKNKDSCRFSNKVILKKACYSDLHKILEFYVKMGYNKQFIEKELGYQFLIGSVYFMSNSFGEILGALCVALDNSLGYVYPKINHIAYKSKYVLACIDLLNKIIGSIVKFSKEDFVPISFSLKEDIDKQEVIKKMTVQYSPVKLVEDGIISYHIVRYKGSLYSKQLDNVESFIEYCKKNEDSFSDLVKFRREDLKNLLPTYIYNRLKLKL